MGARASKGIDNNKVILLNKKGYRNSDIARTMGCSPSRISQILKAFKPDTPKPQRLDIGKVRALWMAGWSIDKIADEVGRDPQFIKQTMVNLSRRRTR